MADEFKKSDLEILVSTMNRTTLDFLIPMFPFLPFSNFSILVLNQTTHDRLLESQFPNVRVINSLEKGLSKSRNLALQNTTAKIALIADDDVEFIKDFDTKIIEAYNKNKSASVVCFQTLTKENQPFSNYKNQQFWMKEKDLNPVLSIEITFKPEDLREKKIIFNEHFGLGAQFQDAESLFFLRRANYNNLRILFSPETIVIHEKYSSSDEVVSDRLLYAKMASFHKRYGAMSYLLLLKFIFFLLRKRLISFKEIKHKFEIGLKGITDYKTLLNEKKEHKYD